MSHIVQLKAQVHDPAAVKAACRRNLLGDVGMGTTKIYTRTVTGMLVQLPGWRYLVAIDTLTGTIHYDNFNGHWGERRHLDSFLQSYAVEKAKLEARRKGCMTNEVTLQDGSIKLQIMEGS